MDCPACGAFNSVLDEECDSCGMVLTKPREPTRPPTAYRASAAPVTPDRPTERKLRRWVRRELRDGEDGQVLEQAIAKQGFDRGWAQEFVQRIERRLDVADIAVAERSGNYAVGFFSGVLCPMLGLFLLLGAQPRTRRGAVMGLCFAVGFAILARCVGSSEPY